MEVAARGWEQLAEELEHRLTRNTGRQQDIPAGPGSHHREAHPSAPSEQGEKSIRAPKSLAGSSEMRVKLTV
jgi:hypothetical protein